MSCSKTFQLASLILSIPRDCLLFFVNGVEVWPATWMAQFTQLLRRAKGLCMMRNAVCPHRILLNSLVNTRRVSDCSHSLTRSSHIKNGFWLISCIIAIVI